MRTTDIHVIPTAASSEVAEYQRGILIFVAKLA
jgi:hypothetical protein